MAEKNEAAEAQSTDSGFAALISVCASCKENLPGREPQFLPCLHTFCKSCIDEFESTNADGTANNPDGASPANADTVKTPTTPGPEGEDVKPVIINNDVQDSNETDTVSVSNTNTTGVSDSVSPDPGNEQPNSATRPSSNTQPGQDIKCKICKCTFPRNSLIENVMAIDVPKLPSQDTAPENEEESTADKLCTACEENIPATSFCQDCSEWLCDQCVKAHRRVRITKDHTIQTKEDAIQESTVEATVGSHVQRQMKCPVHKQELLVLYCETCDRLTCRDCQLQEHKDHKYHFLDDAAGSYRQYLKNLIGKVQEKQSYVKNAKSLIETRRKDIKDKESKVLNEIKIFALKLVAEINKRGKQLVSDLNALCSAKTKQLSEKNSEINSLSQRLDYAMRFAKYAADKGNNAELLFTRKILVSELTNILQTRCEVPNPYHVVDIKFSFAPSFIAHVSKQGCISVDGVPYPGHRSQQGQMSMTTTQPQISPNAPPPPLHSQTAPVHSQAAAPQAQTRGSSSQHGQAPPSQLDRQAQQVLMHKARQLHLQQMQYRESMAASRHMAPHSRVPFPNQMNMRPPAQGHHMPHQSSLVSSSNPHQNMRTGFFQPNAMHPQQQQRGPSPPNSSHSQSAQRQLGMINLMQLQQQRTHQHAPAPHPPNTGGNSALRQQSRSMQNPIVIQPTAYDEVPAYPQSRGPPSVSQRMDCRMQATATVPVAAPVNRVPAAADHSGNMKQGDTERSSCSFAKKRRSEDKAPVIDLSAADLSFENNHIALLEEMSNTAHTAATSQGLPSPVGSDHSHSRASTPATVMSPLQEPHTNLQTPPRPPSQDNISPGASTRVLGTISAFEESGLGCLENLLNTITPDMDEESVAGLTAAAAHAAENLMLDPKVTVSSASHGASDKFMPDDNDISEGVADSGQVNNSELSTETEQSQDSQSNPPSSRSEHASGDACSKKSDLKEDADKHNLSDNNESSNNAPPHDSREPSPGPNGPVDNKTQEEEAALVADGNTEPIVSAHPAKNVTDCVMTATPPRVKRSHVYDRNTPEKMVQPRTTNLSSPIRPNARAPDKVMPELMSLSSDDPSEDYCAVCHNGGDLLCCDRCPKVFHLQCHVPTLPEAPSGEWTCTFCIKDDELKIPDPITHGESSTGTSGGCKRRAPDGLTSQEQKTCERILLELFAHESSTPYHMPVSKSIPNYYKIVTHPMHLGLVKSRLCRDHFNYYKTVDEFVQDVNLIFANCSIYNHPESEVGKLGKSLEDFFERRLHHYVPYIDRSSVQPASPTIDVPEQKKRKKEKKKNNIINSDTEDEKSE